MSYVKFILSWAVLTSAACSLPAAEPDAAVLQGLRAARAELGLGVEDDFTIKDALEDELGYRHVRIQQTYRGLPVWGGQAVVHLGRGGQPMTDALVRGLRLEVEANLPASEALAVARDRLAPRGAFSEPPGAELVVWPEPARGALAGAPPLREHLAWHLHAELENGGDETRHEDLLVDAHTGAVLRRWSTLLTARRRHRRPKPPRAPGAPVVGVGASQYSGEVSLSTEMMLDGYQLADPTRGNTATLNLGGRRDGQGQPFTSADNRWGDGQDYDPSRGPRSVNGQTAAVDVHYGFQVAWDFCKNVLGRDGLDGKGTGIVGRVHYDRAYDNAFWSDACGCMTFGDGPSTGSLTTLEVVGHEVSHGICSTTADLVYSGESGGLNESNSDILGTLMAFYARGAAGKGGRVPDRGGSWTLGEQLRIRAYRHMDKPSLDGSSPDAWSPELEAMDPHEASGPMNRAFYFLAQGAAKDPASRTFSPHLPKGMEGLGNDKALRIWWRTLSTRLTPTSGYRAARDGALQSARELYGSGSPEEKAVANAFQAINLPVLAR